MAGNINCTMCPMGRSTTIEGSRSLMQCGGYYRTEETKVHETVLFGL